MPRKIQLITFASRKSAGLFVQGPTVSAAWPPGEDGETTAIPTSKIADSSVENISPDYNSDST